ncbi:MAG: aminotransferase class V-fold PLP-dependent enzyme [Bacteroidetes bacterium]|nr:MAG: aminotransferase class V-fold PLP-dependent enzyme [Bacteroidota bacterium]
MGIRAGLTNLFEEAFFTDLRNREYARLNQQGQIYLDYTGGNLYGSSQILKHKEQLLRDVFGNPHSSNPTSRRATELVDEARQSVIDFFQAEDYVCVFTANASAALKIVGEGYPFDEQSSLLMLADNHNSVNGIREFCLKRKGRFKYIPVQYEDLCIPENELKQAISEANAEANNLLAFPAQSNVSGVKHKLSWVAYAQERGFDVLLDAAAFVPTSKLDLRKVQPDFVSVSFYKIFGYPTGIGCLLIKKDRFHKLQKPWFAGGTVNFVSVGNPSYFLASDHERFEDGTINYLDIPAIKIGLDHISEIGIDKISARVKSLTKALIEQLKELKHDNGRSVVSVFGPDELEKRGGNVILNFFDPEGKPIPFWESERLANERNISIRSGCFCNPGIDEINNCVTAEETAKYFTSRDLGDYHKMASMLGKMRGAVRVSVGIATTGADLEEFCRFVESFKNVTVDEVLARS